MRQMDENFDGRISYNELRNHIKSLGFILTNDTGLEVVKKGGKAIETFVWRDKGLELVIQ